jgi:hypothetical protein
MKPNRILLALVAAVIVGLSASCGTDQSSTTAPKPAPSASLLSSTLNTVTGLLQCTPLPYASNSAVIGPDGGTLQIGVHSLTIPPGALSQSVLITGTAPTDNVNSVQLYPEGLQFVHPASLTMSYANCNTLGLLLPKRIAYTTDLLQILSYLISSDDLQHRQVTGQLNHFSRYAVAW